MTDTEKIELIDKLLDDGGALPSSATLTAYLTLSKIEILQWMYSLIGGVPYGVTEVPAEYEVTQIYSVVAGYTHAGAEGESTHSENGINRTFIYSDMVDYIHKHVLAIARVGAVGT